MKEGREVLSIQRDIKLAALLFGIVGVIVLGLWWVGVFKPSTPTETPVVEVPGAVTPPIPTPTPTPPPPTPTPPTPTPTPTPVRQVLKAEAICNHYGDEQTKCTDDRRITVRALDCNMEINLVEVRYQGLLLEADSVLRINVGEMQLYGAFPEHMHGADLELTVHYTVKIGPCVRLLKTSVIHCIVTPAY